MGGPTVFVVSDDAAVSDSVKNLVEAASLQVEIFFSLPAFLDAVEPDCLGCLVIDACASDVSDLECQARLAAVFARIPGIVITDRGDVPTAVCAMKAGATDVVQKPYRDCTLLDTIENAMTAN